MDVLIGDIMEVFHCVVLLLDGFYFKTFDTQEDADSYAEGFLKLLSDEMLSQETQAQARADGATEEYLKDAIKLGQDIKYCLENGNIGDAIDCLNKHNCIEQINILSREVGYLSDGKIYMVLWAAGRNIIRLLTFANNVDAKLAMYELLNEVIDNCTQNPDRIVAK